MDQQNFSSTLDSELSKAAVTRPVSELQSKGVRRVRVLDRRRLENAARVAINRTLREQIEDLEVDRAVRDEIERRALAEFTRLVDTGLAPESAATDSPADLHTLFAQEQRKLHSMVEGGDPEPASSTTAVEPVTDEIRAMESRMASDLDHLIDTDWRAQLAQVESTHREQLGVLEQRISKLVRALESTDRILAHLQQQAPTAGSNDEVELGEAELDPSSPLFEKKSQLLTALFQANLELKELEGDGDAEAA